MMIMMMMMKGWMLLRLRLRLLELTTMTPVFLLSFSLFLLKPDHSGRNGGAGLGWAGSHVAGTGSGSRHTN